MRCPFCNKHKTRCINTRPNPDGSRYRRYLCTCLKRFSTRESVVEHQVKEIVVKLKEKKKRGRPKKIEIEEKKIDAVEIKVEPLNYTEILLEDLDEEEEDEL